ncbi:hypothetical protein CEXT_378351 [Caerostris extrusa]|uniref:Uncharacterized protein n=1 Tax=Caerostris extrusa TaxID=172846 RepID=A0AAV4PXS7_CAEEX|nr:hypothetical protein CEXT_378351 [Caerostris extrusa]
MHTETCRPVRDSVTTTVRNKELPPTPPPFCPRRKNIVHERKPGGEGGACPLQRRLRVFLASGQRSPQGHGGGWSESFGVKGPCVLLEDLIGFSQRGA